MSMTKKDYEGIAAALRPHVIDAGQNVVKSIADFCAAENPRFDREKFYAIVNGAPVSPRPGFFQHLRAPNDPNGNPQRLYMIFDTRGVAVRVVDEGYKGLPPELRGVVELPSVEISRSQYHRIKREWRADCAANHHKGQTCAKCGEYTC